MLSRASPLPHKVRSTVIIEAGGGEAPPPAFGEIKKNLFLASRRGGRRRPPRIVCGNYMNILIVGPSWVGDMVMAQTLFQCLKQRHPDCQIDVLAPEWSRPILERMPQVRQALSFPLGHGALLLGTRRRIGKSLAGQYDQAILLPNSLKSALVPFFAGIPKRTGWRGGVRYR